MGTSDSCCNSNCVDRKRFGKRNNYRKLRHKDPNNDEFISNKDDNNESPPTIKESIILLIYGYIRGKATIYISDDIIYEISKYFTLSRY